MSAWDMPARLAPEVQAQLVEDASARLKGLPLDVLRDRQQLQQRAMAALSNVAARAGVGLPPSMLAVLVGQVVASLGGLGFLNDLLPPTRNDLNEITLTPEGDVWVLPKGERFFQRVDIHPSKEETFRTVEALLAPLGRSLTEAVPSVDAKLPRMPGVGGARIKALHPVIAPGAGYPSLNIRLFEPVPVSPEQIVSWGVAPMEVIQALMALVGRAYRVMVIGGTATGKTTLLSAIANGIPKDARVVKIEEPEEIYLDHPHVVTIEARPTPPGSDVPAYTVRDGVNDAMRMSPQWLIVGEVRTGDAAMSLFRAQMSDHPGLTTFHAEGPEKAVTRMEVILSADAGVPERAARSIFFQAVDIIVQIGWLDGRRRIVGVWEATEDGAFRVLYRHGDATLTPPQKERSA
ncbi:MAG: CpaF family protein [Deltaproteobacteria bacterium]|nr:MAG: CpaF family protein [Deltaproteobacteria bacterium]